MLVACALLLVAVRVRGGAGAGAGAGAGEADPITYTDIYPGISSTQKIDKGVNILKDELQRNNDDYMDRIPEGKQDLGERPEAGHRRFDDDAQSDDLADDDDPAAGHRRFEDDAPSDGLADAVDGPAPVGGVGSDNTNRAVTVTPVINYEKMNKLRNYLDKYKVMVNEMVANHSDAPPPARQSPPARQTAPAGAGISPARGGRPGEKPVMRTSGSGEKLAMPASNAKPVKRAPAEKPVMRASHVKIKGAGRTGGGDGGGGVGGRGGGGATQLAPGGSELDMAPARGGLVHSLRHKHRLCFRHVMVPEGPKYDSTGKQYLAEYAPVHGHDYRHTAPPALLLPKCCNCCKKSVLGCS